MTCFRWLSLILLSVFAGSVLQAGEPKGKADAEKMKIQVVAILASTQHSKIDPKLTKFAEEVQRKEKKLTGFQIGHMDIDSIPFNETKEFRLVDKETVEVTANKKLDDNGVETVTITVKPPGLTQMSYNCVCGKFFSMVTNYKTKEGELLIIAIEASPCKGKKK
jgi:hypothetical protein